MTIDIVGRAELSWASTVGKGKQPRIKIIATANRSLSRAPTTALFENSGVLPRCLFISHLLRYSHINEARPSKLHDHSTTPYDRRHSMATLPRIIYPTKKALSESTLRAQNRRLDRM